jgi:hypothetical protein
MHDLIIFLSGFVACMVLNWINAPRKPSDFE